MMWPIFFTLMAINFNVASGNPHGTVRSAARLNKAAVLSQWIAIILAIIIGVYVLVT